MDNWAMSIITAQLLYNNKSMELALAKRRQFEEEARRAAETNINADENEDDE